ncbi:MAG TPA: UDP-N-acetylmuramoyl-L-alanine--D-glutamate ligase, partial [Rubrivivax sp.]|nr:UDP-N-acetylmuramoyl-L-alanine--D-glutamate ligase [Rubrivivax sp.]
MARWCARCGAQVTVWDSRENPPRAAALQAEVPAASRIAALPASLTAAPLLILKSPGLSPLDPAVAPLLEQARAAGVAVLGELDLFVRALADLKADRGYAPRVLAVTGTNGKTPTTAMAALLVQRSGRSVVAAGNIGPALLDTLSAHWDALPEVWVLELSSFQLEGG